MAQHVDRRATIEIEYHHQGGVWLEAKFHNVKLTNSITLKGKHLWMDLHMWGSAAIEVDSGYWRLTHQETGIASTIRAFGESETRIEGNLSLESLSGKGDIIIGEGINLHSRTNAGEHFIHPAHEHEGFDFEVSGKLTLHCQANHCSIRARELTLTADTTGASIEADTLNIGGAIREAVSLDIANDLTAHSMYLLDNSKEHEERGFKIGGTVVIAADCDLGNNDLLASNVVVGHNITNGGKIECAKLIVNGDCIGLANISSKLVIIQGRLEVLDSIETVHMYVGSDFDSPVATILGNATLPTTNVRVRELIWKPDQEEVAKSSQFEEYDDAKLSDSLRVSFDMVVVNETYSRIYAIDMNHSLSLIRISWESLPPGVAGISKGS